MSRDASVRINRGLFRIKFFMKADVELPLRNIGTMIRTRMFVGAEENHYCEKETCFKPEALRRQGTEPHAGPEESGGSRTICAC